MTEYVSITDQSVWKWLPDWVLSLTTFQYNYDRITLHTGCKVHRLWIHKRVRLIARLLAAYVTYYVTCCWPVECLTPDVGEYFFKCILSNRSLYICRNFRRKLNKLVNGQCMFSHMAYFFFCRWGPLVGSLQFFEVKINANILAGKHPFTHRRIYTGWMQFPDRLDKTAST